MTSAMSPKATSSDARCATVLIATDLSSEQEALTEYFKGKGHTILSAKTLTDARQLLTSSKIDSVVVLSRMPDGSGLTFINEFKTRVNGPAVLICGENEPIVFQRAYRLGGDALFVRPCNPELVERTITRLLADCPPSRVQRWQRVQARYNLVLKKPGSGEIHYTETINISRGGLFVSIENTLPAPNEMVEFRLYPDENAPPIVGQGVVRWQKSFSEMGSPRGIGIEFKDLARESENQISDLVCRDDWGAIDS
jgi:CheY-like chemotaxis protein